MNQVAVGRAGVRAAVVLLLFGGLAARHDQGQEGQEKQRKQAISSFKSRFAKEKSQADYRSNGTLASGLWHRREAWAIKISWIPGRGGFETRPYIGDDRLDESNADFLLPGRRLLDKFNRSRDVAQPGRAQRSGRWGRRFKSSRPDHSPGAVI